MVLWNDDKDAENKRGLTLGLEKRRARLYVWAIAS
jgi:hypothetical protein